MRLADTVKASASRFFCMCHTKSLFLCYHNPIIN